METLSGHRARPFDTPVGKEPLIIVKVMLSCWLSFQGIWRAIRFAAISDGVNYMCIYIYIKYTYLSSNIIIVVYGLHSHFWKLWNQSRKKKLTNPRIQFSSWYIDPMMKLFGRNSSGKTLPQSIVESPHFTTRFIFGPMRVYVAGSPSVYSHTKITDPVKLHQVSMLFAGPKSKVETLSTSLRCAYKTWLPNTRLLWNKQIYQPALGELGNAHLLMLWNP